MKTAILSQLKNTLTFFCVCASLTWAQAQSSFSITPSNTITSAIDCDSVKDLHFYVVNPNANDISLDWRVKSNSLPLGNDLGGSDGCWDYMLCDWQLCVFQIPPVDQVISRIAIKANTTKNDMKLAVLPGKNKGNGTLVIEIFEKNFPSNSKTVTWNVTGCTAGKECTAGVSEAGNNTRFSVYPNPAADYINIEITSGYTKNGTIQVYNLVGEKIMEVKGINNNLQKINLEKLNMGGYFIKYSTEEGESVRKFFKTH